MTKSVFINAVKWLQINIETHSQYACMHTYKCIIISEKNENLNIYVEKVFVEKNKIISVNKWVACIE